MSNARFRSKWFRGNSRCWLWDVYSWKMVQCISGCLNQNRLKFRMICVVGILWINLRKSPAMQPMGWTCALICQCPCHMGSHVKCLLWALHGFQCHRISLDKCWLNQHLNFFHRKTQGGQPIKSCYPSLSRVRYNVTGICDPYRIEAPRSVACWTGNKPNSWVMGLWEN